MTMLRAYSSRLRASPLQGVLGCLAHPSPPDLVCALQPARDLGDDRLDAAADDRIRPPAVRQVMLAALGQVDVEPKRDAVDEISCSAAHWLRAEHQLDDQTIRWLRPR